jgi:hypothetical protein
MGYELNIMGKLVIVPIDKWFENSFQKYPAQKFLENY